MQQHVGLCMVSSKHGLNTCWVTACWGLQRAPVPAPHLAQFQVLHLHHPFDPLSGFGRCHPLHTITSR